MKRDKIETLSCLRINRKRCTGCGMCSKICSKTHLGIVQDDFYGIKVSRTSTNRLSPHYCLHCGKCIVSCPTKAIFIDPDMGNISINPLKCNLCSDSQNLQCVIACPSKVISPPIYDIHTPLYPESIPFVCDFCNGSPMCVIICPNDAISVKELDQNTFSILSKM